MPKLELTPEELEVVKQGLAQAEASAKRAQNTSKQPQIKQVYEQHEAFIKGLQAKIATAR